MNANTDVKEVESLFLRLNIARRLELDLEICYDIEHDKMVYSHQDDKKYNHLPLIISIPAYVVGYFKGVLGSKRFNKLKKDILRVVRDDYKSGSLQQKESHLLSFLLLEYNLTLPTA